MSVLRRMTAVLHSVIHGTTTMALLGKARVVACEPVVGGPGRVAACDDRAMLDEIVAALVHALPIGRRARKPLFYSGELVLVFEGGTKRIIRIGIYYERQCHAADLDGMRYRFDDRYPWPRMPVEPTYETCGAWVLGKVGPQGKECRVCGWVKDSRVRRERWGHEGRCPRCGFEYRWDGTICYHCGLQVGV